MADTSRTLPALLLRDHAEIKQLLGQLDKIPEAERPDRFQEVVHALARHEVAEELVLYPRLRQLPGGASLADLGLAEQAGAEETLTHLEKEPMHDPNWLGSFAGLRSSVLQHAEHEEEEMLALLRRELSEEELISLGDRYEAARRAAPTHPHPNAPDTPPGNLVAGPVASVVDRVRDALRKAHRTASG